MKADLHSSTIKLLTTYFSAKIFEIFTKEGFVLVDLWNIVAVLYYYNSRGNQINCHITNSAIL